MQDELLPPSQMRELRAAVPDPKRCTWVEFPYAGHMDAYELARTEYWPAVADFFESQGLGASREAFDEEGLDEEVMEQVSFLTTPEMSAHCAIKHDSITHDTLNEEGIAHWLHPVRCGWQSVNMILAATSHKSYASSSGTVMETRKASLW